MKKKNKHKLPVFDSDEDLLKAFEALEEKKVPELTQKAQTGPVSHRTQEEQEEDFAALLEESLQKSRAKPMKRPAPVPLEKRLKRYPRPEKALDLHGYTALGAEVRARSFIHSCKQQGFFTIRIIVGKGRHSDEGAVLPDVVEDVARETKKQGIVIGFEWENTLKSKSGALILYLKQFERFDG